MQVCFHRILAAFSYVPKTHDSQFSASEQATRRIKECKQQAKKLYVDLLYLPVRVDEALWDKWLTDEKDFISELRWEFVECSLAEFP